MPSYVKPRITLSGLPTVTGDFQRPYSEPCTWKAVLDNKSRTYGFTSDIANPAAYTGTFNLNLLDSEGETWSSPDLVLKLYDYDTGTVSISGKCKLDLMDRNSQNIIVDSETGSMTVENMPLNEVLQLLADTAGLTVSGAPSTNVVEWHLADINPLKEFQKLCDPTLVFYMGSGNTIIVESATDHTLARTLTGHDDLFLLKFSRSDELTNAATVERIVPQPGRVVLFDEGGSGGSEIEETNGPHALSEPSRSLTFEIKEALRGRIIGIVLLDESGDPIYEDQFTMPSYTGTVPVHSFTFIYDVNELADSWPGEWTPQWHIRITGLGLDAAPVPLEGYSATATAGAGDRPYEEAFSSAAINNQTEAGVAAQALADRGARAGNVLNVATRLTADVPTPNAGVRVTDWHAEISSLDCVLELLKITWAAKGDSGTMSWDMTFLGVE